MKYLQTFERKAKFSSEVDNALAVKKFETWYVRKGKVQQNLYDLFINKSRKFNRTLQSVLNTKFKKEMLMFTDYYQSCKEVIKQIG